MLNQKSASTYTHIQLYSHAWSWFYLGLLKSAMHFLADAGLNLLNVRAILLPANRYGGLFLCKDEITAAVNAVLAHGQAAQVFL